MLEVRIDNAKIREFERKLKAVPGALPRVMRSGLNRTATQARTQIGRHLAGETGIKVGDVRSRIYMRKATLSKWSSALTVNQKRLSLSLLNPKATRRGLSVKSGRKRILIRQAFPVRSSWFTRLPIAGSYKGQISVADAQSIGEQKLVARLPIAAIKGPILAQVYRNAEAEVNRIQAESLVKLQKNIHDQVQRILQRRAG